MTGLVIDDISMRFDLPNGSTVQALQNISLTLEPGELLSVLGPSGCGKTTLLNILAGFLAPTGGQVMLGDRRVTGPSSERGMVFQQGALFEWMNVRRNVDFGPRMKGMAEAERTRITDQLLETVGLGAFKDKAVYELSGGMQQRVALARCLANDPEVILMDEPLGALDALTREKMQGLVLKIWKETGKTVVLITHSVEEALLLGERLIVMAPRPGRIFKEYRLPFAERGVGQDLRDVKKSDGFAETRERADLQDPCSLFAGGVEMADHAPRHHPELAARPLHRGAGRDGGCWGTVVAAERVAAQKGAGMMIIAAPKFQLTDIVVMGIILIGLIGYGIDNLMRIAERKEVPWKKRG